MNSSAIPWLQHLASFSSCHGMTSMGPRWTTGTCAAPHKAPSFNVAWFAEAQQRCHMASLNREAAVREIGIVAMVEYPAQPASQHHLLISRYIRQTWLATSRPFVTNKTCSSCPNTRLFRTSICGTQVLGNWNGEFFTESDRHVDGYDCQEH